MTDKDQYEYKVKQLEKMLEVERNSGPNEQYGAHLTHWYGNSNPIQIHAGALQVLINYYKDKIFEEEKDE